VAVPVGVVVGWIIRADEQQTAAFRRQQEREIEMHVARALDGELPGPRRRDYLLGQRAAVRDELEKRGALQKPPRT
jgi:hypothetical protein